MASGTALLVASADYRDPKLRRLRAPAWDAQALGRVLADPAIGEFEVELALNEPEHVLRRKIARFFADRRRDELLLLHMSCHGLKDDDGNLYFATVDTEFDHLDSTAVSAEFVHHQMTRSRSGRIVLLLDCCYSGAFSQGMAPRAGAGVELKERFAERGRAVISASNAMEYSFEGDDLSGEGKPAIFTSAVVQALETGQADRDGDGWISVDELYDYVYEEIRDKSPQRPVRWLDLEGDLRIAKSVYVPPVQPTELPVDLRAAVESPLRAARLGAVQELSELLAESDQGQAKTAHDALKTLAEDDSQRVSAAAKTALLTAEEQARREAKEQARRQAEEQARREAETQARREAETQARRESEAQARRESEAQARREAEAQARRESEEQARRESEEQARREAEAQARRYAERPRAGPSKWWSSASAVAAAPQAEPKGESSAPQERPIDRPAVDWSGRARQLLKVEHPRRGLLGRERAVNRVAFSPDGRQLATASWDNTARVWELPSGRQLLQLDHQGVVRGVAFSPDGRQLATASWDNTARVWELPSGRQLLQLDHQGVVRGVAFSPDGRQLATASWDGTARVWELRSGRQLLQLDHQNTVSGVAFSPDGRQLATASWDGTARVWELRSGRQLLQLDHQSQGRVRGVAFSPDGRQLATASGGGTARVWELPSGRQLLQLNHQGQVVGVAFSPDGRYVATASWDGTACVWELPSGRQLLQLNHKREVVGVAFSPDGRQLATASDDGTARVWEAPAAQR